MSTPGRLIIDISTLAGAGGQADGTVRTARELALWANANARDVEFAVFDSEKGVLRAVHADWLLPVLTGTATIDLSRLPDPRSGKRRIWQRLPPGLKDVARWMMRPRRQAYVTLERARLAVRSPAWQRRIERCQQPLLSQKYRRALTDSKGRRRTLIPFDLAMAQDILPGAGDILVFAWSEFGMLHARRLSGDPARRPKVALLCYDTIPLLFPSFYPASSVGRYREYFHTMFAVADLVIFTAKRVEEDSRAYCASQGIALRRTGIISLGADFEQPASASHAKLPPGLRPQHFALFVSTIEPRKGHRMLYSVWKRLLAENVPQSHDFKLVFVGKRGWLVEDLLAELDRDPIVGASLLVLSDVDDVALTTLYAQAAFCVYPSLYEGYGLPVIEGFCHGKAVLASNGGALPEVVGDFSPCLDPRDADAWQQMLRAWIEQPHARAHYEMLIRTQYRKPTWSQSAARFFELIDSTIGTACARSLATGSEHGSRP
ncbi:MAG: glycosyltransferase family 4 protein [Proteobacteria bacterium]|nr:glycosyltransferase family 4 protein [Pseudomonadota bacterium]